MVRLGDGRRKSADSGPSVSIAKSSAYPVSSGMNSCDRHSPFRKEKLVRREVGIRRSAPVRRIPMRLPEAWAHFEFGPEVSGQLDEL